jgi:hypothetical protein
MDNLCLDLNITLSLFKPEIDWRQFKTKQVSLDIPQVINPDLLKLFKDNFIYVYHMSAFYLPPNHTGGGIHIDQSDWKKADPGDYTKINWIFGGKDSTMNWYSINSGADGVLNVTGADTLYRAYAPNEVTHIHSQSVGHPSLVQTGVPHDITNLYEDRLCISASFTRSTWATQPTWKDSLKLLNSFL